MRCHDGSRRTTLRTEYGLLADTTGNESSCYTCYQVWLHDGQLHLIPLQHTSPAPQTLDPDDAKSYLSPADAVSLVQNPTVNTSAPEAVQDAVFNRINQCVLQFSQTRS